MSHRKISASSLIFALLWLAVGTPGSAYARSNLAPQEAKVESGNGQFDPLKALTSAFPGSVTLKNKGHLLEFCPDNTCHGFVSSASVPVTKLKDFAYLYIYFLSEYIYLPDWRSHAEAKNAAERVLSAPEYRNCKSGSDRQTARCILLDLSRDEKIKLIFVRYDENRRNVVPEDIPKELSKKPAETQ